MPALALAYDYASVRSYDADGRLHVERANISKACVSDYLGREIPGWQALGLDEDRVYPLLRDPDELAKATTTFNGLPVLSRHVATSADDHPHDLVVGATGGDAAFIFPYLENSLAIWDQDAIDRIGNDTARELSSAYRYRLDLSPGTFEGRAFIGRMVDIVGNHVAIVDAGRCGGDVIVGDGFSRFTKNTKSTRQLWAR